MLVHPDASAVSAKALTHATVKWPWLAQVAGGRHVLRLSYATTPTIRAPGADATGPLDGTATDGVATSLPVDPDDAVGQRALRDATTLLGVPLSADRVTGAARVGWHGPDLTAAGLAEGVVGIGETAAGRGLAGIIAAARATAGQILGT